jgi:hypothetical protein
MTTLPVNAKSLEVESINDLRKFLTEAIQLELIGTGVTLRFDEDEDIDDDDDDDFDDDEIEEVDVEEEDEEEFDLEEDFSDPAFDEDDDDEEEEEFFEDDF